MKFIHLFLFTFLIVSCSTDATKTTKNTSKTELDTNLNVVELDIKQGFVKKFTGTIGKFPVTFFLSAGRLELTGYYFYESKKQMITISGLFKDSTNSFELQEYDEVNQTAWMKGKFINSQTIKGTWTNAKNKKSLPLSLKEDLDFQFNMTLKFIQKTDCELAIKNRKTYNDEMLSSDTMCSELTLDYLDFENLDIEVDKKIQKLIDQQVCNSNGKERFSCFMNAASEEGNDGYYSYSNATSLVYGDTNLLVLANSGYSFNGGAHGLGSLTFLNINRETGNEITLKDIIDTKNMNKLNALGFDIFKKKYGDSTEGWWFNDGKFVLNDNVAIYPNGLNFLFQQYEVGPYAFGMPEILIPYARIKQFLKPNVIPAIFIK